MATIQLEGLEFYAYHGYYKEEQKLGSKYSVDINLNVDIGNAAKNDDLTSTINYETVYKIVSEIMETKVHLLEHLVFKINQQILETFPDLGSVESKVSKHNPPIKGLCKAVSVTLESKR